MIKIAGTKSNDKINFKEFVDFFYKVDWVRVLNLQSLNGGIGMHTVERAWAYSLSVHSAVNVESWSERLRHDLLWEKKFAHKTDKHTDSLTGMVRGDGVPSHYHIIYSHQNDFKTIESILMRREM